MFRLLQDRPARCSRTGFALAMAGATALAQASAHAAEACMAKSGPAVASVVELYTSEGCNSCPPADQWLSKIKADPAVVALAFHVDYWDRLGWKDRFASPAFTERQSQQQKSNGARFSYTPQVVVDGQDRTDWPGVAVPASARPASTVELQLRREGDSVTATVVSTSRAPKRLAAYWALTEQGHVSAVKAGENNGVTLHHDHVVRAYQQVPAWTPSTAAPQSVAYRLPAPGEPGHARELNLVVVDADTGRPVQAVKLGC